MAIRKQQLRNLQAIEIISQFDEAVDKDQSDIKAYMEDCIRNRDKLVLRPGIEPTIFLCKFKLSANDRALIDDSMVSGYDKEAQSAKLRYGSWKKTVARICLKDIRNPAEAIQDGIEFKKDGSGYVLDSTLDELSEMGIVDEIWSHFMALTGENSQERQEVKLNAKK